MPESQDTYRAGDVIPSGTAAGDIRCSGCGDKIYGGRPVWQVVGEPGLLGECCGSEDPFRSLWEALAFDAIDGPEPSTQDLAWMYGIVVGWDDPAHEGAMDRAAERWGWSLATVARLRRMHAEYVRRVELSEDGKKQ